MLFYFNPWDRRGENFHGPGTDIMICCFNTLVQMAQPNQSRPWDILTVYGLAPLGQALYRLTPLGQTFHGLVPQGTNTVGSMGLLPLGHSHLAEPEDSLDSLALFVWGRGST